MIRNAWPAHLCLAPLAAAFGAAQGVAWRHTCLLLPAHASLHQLLPLLAVHLQLLLELRGAVLAAGMEAAQQLPQILHTLGTGQLSRAA